MTKQILLLGLLIILITSCSKDEEEPQIMDPDPLSIVRIDGFVSTGSTTFQVTNMLNSDMTENIQVISPFFVVFSKPVMSAWLTNESLPKLLKIENGEAVAGVNVSFTYPSNQEINMEPNEPLEPGTTYQLVINPGYEAEDGGILEEHVIVNFKTVIE